MMLIDFFDELSKDDNHIEMLCPKNLKDRAANTLIESHPYETPAFEFIAIES